MRPARHLVDGLHLPDDVAEVARLLASELATNTVMHAQTPYSVSVYADTQRLTVEVQDHDPTPPITRHGQTPITEGATACA